MVGVLVTAGVADGVAVTVGVSVGVAVAAADGEAATTAEADALADCGGADGEGADGFAEQATTASIRLAMTTR